MAEPMPVFGDEQPLVELNDERHAELDLSHLGRPQDRHYRASEQPDGTILLRPVISDEELEARILADPAIMNSVKEAREHPERMRPRPRRNH